MPLPFSKKRHLRDAGVNKCVLMPDDRSNFVNDFHVADHLFARIKRLLIRPPVQRPHLVVGQDIRGTQQAYRERSRRTVNAAGGPFCPSLSTQVD